ncbi:hypothetical protein M6B38_371665 [Iris pallida]|uniref:Uncharacterized protein n=1 Tax=Iris pallida TaxID=29817 RepID=A0AAX6GCZ9_IRIPA|nr:hypothetical protein M6B38_371665 [Iris pallida]
MIHSGCIYLSIGCISVSVFCGYLFLVVFGNYLYETFRLYLSISFMQASVLGCIWQPKMYLKCKYQFYASICSWLHLFLVVCKYQFYASISFV